MNELRHHEAIKQSLFEFYLYIQVWRDLFAKDLETSTLLREAAPQFFGLVQRAILDHILLSIARLTERQMTSGQDNLTLPRVLDEYKQHPRATSVAQADALWQEINKRREQ